MTGLLLPHDFDPLFLQLPSVVLFIRFRDSDYGCVTEGLNEYEKLNSKWTSSQNTAFKVTNWTVEAVSATDQVLNCSRENPELRKHGYKVSSYI